MELCPSILWIYLKLLFATGMRISELCSLKPSDIDLESNNILIYGKGAKERVIQIGNQEVIAALKLYKETFGNDIAFCFELDTCV